MTKARSHNERTVLTVSSWVDGQLTGLRWPAAGGLCRQALIQLEGASEEPPMLGSGLWSPAPRGFVPHPSLETQEDVNRFCSVEVVGTG